jgi:hypothetical protein
MSMDNLKKVILKDGKFTCFHRIQELTKNEYVAAGSDGNILRWGKTGGQEQKWLIVPVTADGYCKIFTLQNGECMAVGSNGNIVRWTNTQGIEQQFKFVNRRRSDGSYNIQERTQNEYVAVGSDGNILRWGKTDKDEQRFILEPIDEIKPKKEEPSIIFGRPSFAPNEIPTHPPIHNLTDSPPSKSDEYLIGVEVLPSVFVDDPGRTDKIQQVTEQPYYYLVRTRLWKKIYDKKLLPGVEDSVETIARRGSSVTDMKEIETTIGVVVSGKVGAEGEVVSGELSAQFSWQKKELEKHESKKEEYLEKKASTTVSQQSECKVVAWQIVDKFTLYNYDEEPVRMWTVYGDRVDWARFPGQA